MTLTLPELEAAEANDLLMIGQTASAAWLPVTLIAGSMSDGPLRNLHATASALQRCMLEDVETLFPNCNLPHASYTH